ncbi:MAG TPA: hypothetical protein VHN79_06175 [Lacunisphaera sp.]|nr:hypothetical protein [Lacunisphaera sp.]
MTPTLAEARALVAAAHAHGLPVLIHANRKEGQALAVAAGIDVIAHGLWRDHEEPALDEEAQAILASVARDRIGYQPTTQVIAAEPDMRDDAYFSRPELADAYPRVLIDWYAARVHQNTHWTRALGPGADARVRGILARAAEMTRYLAAPDGRLLFGSDTSSDRLYTNPPVSTGAWK